MLKAFNLLFFSFLCFFFVTNFAQENSRDNISQEKEKALLTDYDSIGSEDFINDSFNVVWGGVDVLVLIHDTTVVASQVKRLADKDSLYKALNSLLPSSYDLATFTASTTLSGLSLYKSIILQETSFDDISIRYLNAASRDSLKAWLNGGTAGNKRTLISMGADQGYNYSRAGSAAQDLDLCQNYLKFNYRFDNGNVTGQNSLTGVSIDVGNIRGYTTSPVGAGFWPDAVQPLGSSVLYQYTGRGNTDSVAAVGVNETGFNTLSLFLDPRYFTNGDFAEVLLAVVQEAISNGGSFTGFVPVELISFTASVVDEHVNLNWSTASETNNYGFEVERKTAGQEFSKIGFVGGYGTITESKSYNYVDNTVSSGSYTYRLKQVDFDGTFEYSNEVEVDLDLAPSAYSLAQNYPNPFNPNTKIDFSLASDSKVTLRIFDILGQEVAIIVNANLGAGLHSFNFDASTLNSGVYVYTIDAKGVDGTNFTSTKKMILAK
jgi:hypothetical protein